MHLGILQTGRPSPQIADRHGDFAAMMRRLFAGRGWRFSSWEVLDMEFPPGPEAADAWLITGSRHGAYDALPFIAPLEAFIRAADAARVPLLGICFGHQIVAQAMGGRVALFDGGWSVGRQCYDIEGLGEVALTGWHQDQVVEKPPQAVNMGTGTVCAHAALRYGERILTVQPHPEFDAAVTAAYVAAKRGDPNYPPERLAAAEAALAQPLEGERVAAWMAAFVEAALGQGPRPAGRRDHVAASSPQDRAVRGG